MKLAAPAYSDSKYKAQRKHPERSTAALAPCGVEGGGAEAPLRSPSTASRPNYGRDFAHALRAAAFSHIWNLCTARGRSHPRHWEAKGIGAWALPVALAVIVRIFWAAQPRVVWGDEPFYLWIGQSLWDGRGYQFFGFSGSHFAPLFPLLSGLLARVAGLFGASSSQALIFGSSAIYVIAGALLVLPIYGIARRITGRAAALAAALVTAVSPPLVVGTLLWGTLTEPLFLLLIASAWWALLTATQDDRPAAFALAGALLALAYLVRTEALVYLIAAVLILLVLERRRLIYAGRAILFLVAAFSALISPYLVVQYAQTGQWQLTEEAGFAYTSMQGLVQGETAIFDRATWGLDPASHEVYLFAPASSDSNLIGAITADPRGFVRLVRHNINELFAKGFSVKLIPWPLAMLAVLGLFSRPWARVRLRGEVVLATLLVGPLSFLIFFIQERYLAGALIPAQIWIGAGAIALGGWLTETIAECKMRKAAPASRALRSLPALLLAAALLWQQPSLWATMQQTHSFQPGHLAAADRLHTLGADEASVAMSRYPAIAFHAGTRWAPTPAASWPQVLAYARSHGARYLVIDEWELRLRPQLTALGDPTRAPAELRHLATLDGGNGPVLLYEFTEARP